MGRPMPTDRPVVLLARTLRIGGAERQLAALARGLHDAGVAVVVVVLYELGPLGAELRAAGVRVIALDKRSRWDVFGFLWRYRSVMQELKPNVVYSFHLVPNALALLGRPFVPTSRVVIGLRSSSVGGRSGDALTWVLFRLVAFFSPRADAIISNSGAGASFHANFGYPRDRMTVIPNGIDTDIFAPDVIGAARVRGELGLVPDARLVGNVGRLTALKDHRTFLHACRILAAEAPSLRFAIVGDGDRSLVSALRDEAEALGISDKLLWLGMRRDMAAIYSALDVNVSTSLTEGLPNVIVEAMSCGCPCVVTPAGDSAVVVGSLGVVVPFRDASAVAEGVQRLLGGDHVALRAANREAVKRNFGSETFLRRTREVLNV